MFVLPRLGGAMKQRRLDTATSTTYPGQPHALASGGRHAQLESDVAVPVLQALAIGLATAIGLAIATVLLGGPLAHLDAGEAWTWAGRLAGAAGGLVWAASTVAFVLQHRRALQPARAEPSHPGEDHDQAPEEQEVTVVILRDEDGQHLQYVKLPASKETLHRLARACLYHGRDWSRRKLASVLSQGQYAKLSKAMLAQGLLREIPTGYELTHAGRAILRKYQ
jgi:hypothetical protein